MFWENFYKRCIEQGTKPNPLAKSVGISSAVVTKWKNGSFPNGESLLKLAEALDCSVDYLLGRTDNPSGFAAGKGPFDESQGLSSKNPYIVDIQDFSPAAGQQKSAPPLSDEALQLAAQYDLLDTRGKNTVQCLVELERQALAPAQPEKPKSKTIPLFGNSFAAGIPEPDFGNQWEDYEVPYDTKADFAIRINGDSMEPYLPDGSIALGKRGQPDAGDVGAFLLDGEFLCKQFCQDHLGNIYLFSLNRARRDVDITLWHNTEHSLFCFGKILMKKSVPLPRDW